MQCVGAIWLLPLLTPIRPWPFWDHKNLLPRNTPHRWRQVAIDSEPWRAFLARAIPKQAWDEHMFGATAWRAACPGGP